MAKKKIRNKKKENSKDNYFSKLIIENMARKESFCGEYRTKWEEGGNYLEHACANLIDGYFVLFYMNRVFGIVEQNKPEEAERRLYDRVKNGALEYIENLRKILKNKEIILEDRTKYTKQ